MNFEFGKDREEKIDKFLDTVAWWHHEKQIPTGLFATIGRIETNLADLNKNIKESNNSSINLTSALNKITLWGVIIAGSGILVALTSLILELIKYLHAK